MICWKPLGFLVVLLAGGVLPSRMAEGARGDRPPNVLLILADDLGVEGLGCYGGSSYRTPNLDRLAREGVRFTHAYAQPLCTPTRLELMTGKYRFRNWVAFGIMDPKERTFGHRMRENGYATCMAGKWQFTSYDPLDYPGAAARRGIGMQVKDAGFNEYNLWHTGHTEDKGSRYADPTVCENGRLRTLKGKYGEDVWVDFLGDFMARHRDRPFFAYYSMALPHNPFSPAPDTPAWSDPAKRHEDDPRHFTGMVEYLDKSIGRLIARVEELGLRENTLILFYSDNGTNQKIVSRFRGAEFRGGKGLTTDAGTHVPLIASWKGTTPAGRVCDDLVDATDFLPTLLDAAGGKRPAGLDGRSFLPQLRGRKGQPREWTFCDYDPRPGWDKDQFTRYVYARDRRYKLYDDGRFYDVTADPDEKKPLRVEDGGRAAQSARRKLQSVIARMKASK